MALGLAVAVTVLALGYVVAKRTTEPLQALTRAVERLGLEAWRDPGLLARFERADDEVARLAVRFDEVSRRLRETTVSHDYLDGLLESMLNAVLTIGPVGTEADPLTRVRVRSANPAARALLGYGEDELIGLPLDRLVGSGSAQPQWLDQLRRDGRLPAVEKTLRAKDGREIPVLFTAATLRSRGADSEADVVCVAQDIVDRKVAERQLRALARRLLMAQEEERSRLARELHDDVTQRLGALAIDLGKLARAKGVAATPIEGLSVLQEQTIRLAHDVQGLSRRLHPSILDDLGLAAALRGRRRRCGSGWAGRPSPSPPSPPEDFPRESGLALYRVAQECFQNIQRHAGATEVDVELSVLDGMVRLRIEDNGVGFDPAAARRSGGLGLASMAERTRLAGGRLTIQSKPGEGTRLTVELPLSGAPKETSA